MQVLGKKGEISRACSVEFYCNICSEWHSIQVYDNEDCSAGFNMNKENYSIDFVCPNSGKIVSQLRVRELPIKEEEDKK